MYIVSSTKTFSLATLVLFLDQGLNQSRSDLRCCSDNSGSLPHCAKRELLSWCFNSSNFEHLFKSSILTLPTVWRSLRLRLLLPAWCAEDKSFSILQAIFLCHAVQRLAFWESKWVLLAKYFRYLNKWQCN